MSQPTEAELKAMTPDEQLAARCKDGGRVVLQEHEVFKLKEIGVSDEAIAQYCTISANPNRHERRKLKALERAGLLRR